MQGLEAATMWFWESESQRLKWDPATLPMAAFSDMIQGMMVTDPQRRATMAEVIQHPFWQEFAEALQVEKNSS